MGWNIAPCRSNTVTAHFASLKTYQRKPAQELMSNTWKKTKKNYWTAAWFSRPPHFLLPRWSHPNYCTFLVLRADKSPQPSYHVKGVHLVHARLVGVMVTLDVAVRKLRVEREVLHGGFVSDVRQWHTSSLFLKTPSAPDTVAWHHHFFSPGTFPSLFERKP